MPLIPCTCPNCNSNLEFDNSRDAMFCTYCGTKVLKEQVTQITNNITVADGYQIHDADWYYDNAVELLCEHRWNDAERLIDRMFDAFPLDARVEQMRYIIEHRMEEIEYPHKGTMFTLGDVSLFIPFINGKVTDYISEEEITENIDWEARLKSMPTQYDTIVLFKQWMDNTTFLPQKYKEVCEKIIEDFAIVLSKYEAGVEKLYREKIQREKGFAKRELIRKIKMIASVIIVIVALLIGNSDAKNNIAICSILLVTGIVVFIKSFLSN